MFYMVTDNILHQEPQTTFPTAVKQIAFI